MTKEMLLHSIFNASTVQANYYYLSRIKKQYLEQIINSDLSKTKKRKLIFACSKCNWFIVNRYQTKKNRNTEREVRFIMENFSKVVPADDRLYNWY